MLPYIRIYTYPQRTNVSLRNPPALHSKKTAYDDTRCQRRQIHTHTCCQGREEKSVSNSRSVYSRVRTCSLTTRFSDTLYYTYMHGVSDDKRARPRLIDFFRSSPLIAPAISHLFGRFYVSICTPDGPRHCARLPLFYIYD